jgi:hypothetical protein
MTLPMRRRFVHRLVTVGLGFAAMCGAMPSLALAQQAPYPSAACDAVWQAMGLAHQPGGAVLMVLSPRMVYALKEWRRMRDAAAMAGLSVVVSRDPRVGPQEWAGAVSAADVSELADIPVVEAEAAGGCGLLNHFPSALVGRCGRPHAWPILGVMPSAAWRSLLVDRREAVECG